MTSQTNNLAKLKPVPVFIDVSHQFELGVKVFLFMNYTQVIEAQVCDIFPANEDNMWWNKTFLKHLKNIFFFTDINKTINYVPITADNWYLADVKYNIVLN